MKTQWNIAELGGDHWLVDECGLVNFFTDTTKALIAIDQMKAAGIIDHDQPFSIDRDEDFRVVRFIAYANV